MSKRLRVKYLLFLSHFQKTLIFPTHFWEKKKKKAQIPFHQDPSSGSRVVPCGRTDNHDEATSRFSQFCERAQK